MVNLFDKSAIKIQMLGQFQVWLHQEILTWPTRKCKALFQILLIEPGRLVPADQLLEYLWSDLPPQSAQNNLWVTVSHLRRALQPDLPPRSRSAFIQKQIEGYHFNIESDYWLDCEEFATYINEAQSANHPSERIKAWEAARNLYQGDYLEDEPYSEWAQVPRIQWQRRYEQLLVNLAQGYGRNGRFQLAITCAREILTLDNTNETAFRLLMRSHAALGERTTSIQVYNEAVKVLKDEIGVDPMPETDELMHLIQTLEGKWEFEPSETTTNTPFVGRGKEVEQITQLLTHTSTEQGQVVVISGEPGIGKSRLIQEMTILASQRGFQTLHANCYQVEQTIPYQSVIDLVRQVITSDDQWHKLSPVWLIELGVLAPEINELDINDSSADYNLSDMGENQQVRLYQAIFNLFTNRSDRQKLFLIIEDINWADQATLQCLHFIARNITHVPIALVLSLREEHISTDVNVVEFLNSLHREPYVTFLSLARLNLEDTIAFLEQTRDTADLADRLGKWLYQETNGNPFFFISLIQSLREEGLLENAVETDWQMVARTDPSLVLPDAIRESVLARLQRLQNTERDVLDWMAVYGSGLDFITLQAISRQPKMTLLNAVEQSLERKLLVETSGEYDFAHHKIREVVYYDLSAARRSLYHRQIADTLETLTLSLDKSSILAYHFERGEENEKALIYWMQAGEHASKTYAYQQAAQNYERALALTEQPITQIKAFIGLGRALTLLDEHKPATAIIQQGIELAERYGDVFLHTQLLYMQAQNVTRQHRSDGGKPEVEAALRAAEKAGDELHLAKSYILLTEVQESRGNLSNALITASRAKSICYKLNDKQLEARAQVEIGFLHAQKSEFDQAVEAAERGLELLKGSADRSAQSYALNILGRAFGGRGDYSLALEAFQRSEEKAHIAGDRFLLAQVFNMRGWIHRELCDYENALDYDEYGVDLSIQWDKPSPEISARLNVCLDWLQLGDPQKALGMLEKIENQISSGSFGFHSWRWKIRLLHARGLCLLALDRPENVLDLAEEGLQLAESSAIRKYITLNHELKGMILAKMRRDDEAIASTARAISLADEIQYQPSRWASRYRLADLYHKNGHIQEANNTISEAKRIIQTIATRLEDEALRATFLKAAFYQK